MANAMQRELDSFSREVMGGEFNIREVTKGAFTQARAKLKPEAFKELNSDVVRDFYAGAPYQVWHKHRLLAIDGSRLVLPNHPSVVQEFGVHQFGRGEGVPRSMAMASFLFDPVNLITVDAQLAPYASSERDLFRKHLQYIKPGDLLLMDRGYPSVATFYEMAARAIQFCVRMKEDWWLSVQEFNASGEKEAIVEFMLPKKDRHLLDAFPEMKTRPLRCRLVSVELEGGEKEVLCTSLVDSTLYRYEDFRELYHYRWNVEESYKLFKARLEIENFSGKTAHAVKQDFYAKVFMMTLCAMLAFPIEERVRKESEESTNKHPKKINRTSALGQLKDILVGLFLRKNVHQALNTFDTIVHQTTEIIRPGRSFIRKKKPKPTFSMAYKGC